MCATCLAPLILELAFIWCSTGLWNLLCGGGNRKVWSACGQHEINRIIIYV